MDTRPDFKNERPCEELALLQARLDWHYRAGLGLKRLLTKLRQPPRPRVRTRSPWPRLLAVAALLLVTLGFFGPTDSGGNNGIPGVSATLLSGYDNSVLEHTILSADPVELTPMLALDSTRALSLPFPGEAPIRGSGSEERLPRGPRVNLLLRIYNGSGRTLVLDVGGPQTSLRFDLHGPGVRTLQGRAETLPFLRQQAVTLRPGESYCLPIPYLLGGRPDHARGVYWTRPGHYRLTVRYRVGIVGEARELAISSEPIAISVKEQ